MRRHNPIGWYVWYRGLEGDAERIVGLVHELEQIVPEDLVESAGSVSSGYLTCMSAPRLTFQRR